MTDKNESFDSAMAGEHFVIPGSVPRPVPGFHLPRAAPAQPLAIRLRQSPRGIDYSLKNATGGGLSDVGQVFSSAAL
jgi:hypothetical protein